MRAPDSTALFLDDLPPFAEIHKTLNRGLTLRVRPTEEDTVAAGTNVLQQPPLVVLKCGSRDEAPAFEDVFKAVRSLDEDDRRAYDALDRVSNAVRDCDYLGIQQPLPKGLGPEEMKAGGSIIKVWVANVRVCGHPSDRTYFTVYRTISRVNHSCSPNCVVDLNPATQVGHLRTLGPVAPSEEFTIAYTNILDPRRIRQRDLRRCYGFKCACWACEISEAQAYDSDDRRHSIKSFSMLFQAWANGASYKAAELVARFMELYRDGDGAWALERIWLEQADALDLMVMVFAEHGNYNHTATFARAAADRLRIEFGAYDARAEMCDRVAVDPTTHVKWAKRKAEMFAVNGRIGWPVYLPEVEATPPPAKKKKKNKKKKPRRKQIEGADPEAAEPDSDAELDSPSSRNPYPTPPKNALELSLALTPRNELAASTPSPASPAPASALSRLPPTPRSPTPKFASPQLPPSPVPSDHSPDAYSPDANAADEPSRPPSTPSPQFNSPTLVQSEPLLPPRPSLRPAPSPEMSPLDLDALPPSIAPLTPTHSDHSPIASEHSGSQMSSVFHDASEESPTTSRPQLPASPPPETERSPTRSSSGDLQTQDERSSEYSSFAADSAEEWPAAPAAPVSQPVPAEDVPRALEDATLAKIDTSADSILREEHLGGAEPAMDAELPPSSDDVATPMSLLAGIERVLLGFSSDAEKKETSLANDLNFDSYPAPTTLDYFSHIPKSGTPPVGDGLRVRTPLSSIKKSYEQKPLERQVGRPVEQPQPTPAASPSPSPSPKSAPNSVFPFPHGLKSHLPRSQSPLSTAAHTAEPVVAPWRRKGAVAEAAPLPKEPAPLPSKPPPQLQPKVQVSSSYSSKLGHPADPTHAPGPRPSPPPPLDPRQEKHKLAQAAQKTAISKMEKKLEKKLARAQNPVPPLAVNSGLARETPRPPSPHVDSLAETLGKVASTIGWLPNFEADRINSTLDRMRAESYPEELPLSAPWSLCYLFHSKETSNRSSYSQDRTVLVHSTTVPNLCGALKALKSSIARLPSDGGKPSGITTILRNGSSLSFFRDSITPTWEDHANKMGGRIMILPKTGTFEPIFWDLVLLLAGATLESEAAVRDFGGARGGTVVGLVASCRRLGAERIEIWVNGPNPSEAPSKYYIDALKDALARELRIPDFETALFKKHN